MSADNEKTSMTFSDMRTAFEQYAKAEGLGLAEHTLYPIYLGHITQAAWKSWNAAHVALGAYTPGTGQ